MMAWALLFVAGLFEVGWAIGLKYTEGFTKFWPSFATLSTMSVSIFLLSQAIRTIPVGTGYAVWTGVGAVGTVIFGMVVLGESREIARMACLLLIIVGIIGLKIVSPP
jgi:quaternary ammonium compound-resistance protein SugE